MKSLLLVLALSLAPVAAFARRTGHQPTGWFNTYNGKEARALYAALKGTGAKESTSGKDTYFSIDAVDAQSRSNTNGEETDPCFKKPSYSVSFTDQNDNERKVDLDERGNCGATKAGALFRQLSAMGGDDVLDCAMGGRCGFKANNVFVSHHTDKAGDDAWYAQVLVSNQ